MRRTAITYGVSLFTLFTLITCGCVRAQSSLPCTCEKGFISVGTVDCVFKVCVTDANGQNCYVVSSGSLVTFPCSEKAVISLVDCDGNLVDVHNDMSNCVECVCVRSGCCVDACVDRTADGCLFVKIVPSVCGKC